MGGFLLHFTSFHFTKTVLSGVALSLHWLRQRLWRSCNHCRNVCKSHVHVRQKRQGLVSRKTSVFFLNRQFFAKLSAMVLGRTSMYDNDWRGGEAVDRRSNATRTMSVSEPRKACFLHNASGAKSRPDKKN